jgi:hypothetical protein
MACRICCKGLLRTGVNMHNLQMNLVKVLVEDIKSFLGTSLKGEAELEILEMLKSIPLEKKNYVYQKSDPPPREASLKTAISYINVKALLSIKRSILCASRNLRWIIDNGTFYEKDSGISNEFLKGNMHTELIGPYNGVFKFKDFRMGLFLLEANIFYQDHMHSAPEVYLNLSDGTKWRFGDKKWVEKKAGTIVYNKPNKIHAMQVGNKPFLSIWCWPHNSSDKCILVSHRP